MVLKKLLTLFFMNLLISGFVFSKGGKIKDKPLTKSEMDALIEKRIQEREEQLLEIAHQDESDDALHNWMMGELTLNDDELDSNHSGPVPYSETLPYTKLSDLACDDCYESKENNDAADRDYWRRTKKTVAVKVYDNKGDDLHYGQETQKEHFPIPEHRPLLPLATVSQSSQMGSTILRDVHATDDFDGMIFLDPQGGSSLHCIFDSPDYHETMCTRGPSKLAGTRNKIDEYPKALKAKVRNKVRENPYDYLDPVTGDVIYVFDLGHGVDFKDGTLDSTHAVKNFSPQNGDYNRHLRGPLVNHIISAKDLYIEIAIYSTNPPRTRNGTPIPEGFLFIHQGQNGSIINAYYFPNLPRTYKKKVIFQRGFDYKGKDTKKEYEAYLKRKKLNKSQFARYKFLCEKFKLKDFNYTGFDYHDALSDKSINTFIHNTFSRVRAILRGESLSDFPHLRTFIALQLMGQAATLEYNRIDGGARLLSILTGYNEVDGIPFDVNKARTLFKILIHRAFYHLHGLRMRIRDWSPESEAQAQNQMVALYQLLIFTGQNTQAAVIRAVTESYVALEHEDNDGWGIHLFKWGIDKAPNQGLSMGDTQQGSPGFISRDDLFKAFYDTYALRDEKENSYLAVFEGAPVRFREHHIRGDGNCGFTGLGIRRSDALMELLRRGHDPIVRALVFEDAALNQDVHDNLNDIMTNDYTYGRYILRYQNQDEWLSLIAGENVGGGLLGALAYIYNLNVYVWRRSELNQLELLHGAMGGGVNAQNTIHLLHVGGNHFNLLTLQDLPLEDTLPHEEATVESWTTSSMTTNFLKNLLGLFLLYMQNANQKHKSL